MKFKTQTITLFIACTALLLGTASLWLTISEIQARRVSEESLALMLSDNNVRLSRMQLCVEQDIELCNVGDLTRPIDLSTVE